jgi:hypothetical protein
MNRILLTLAATLLPAQAGSAQEAPAPGTPLALVVREKVQKELKLSDEQARALQALHADVKKGKVEPAAARERLRKALKAEQMIRLEQISYQVRGGAALLDSDLAAALGLTKKQKADVAEHKADADRQLRMFLAVARFRNAQARVTFISNHYKKFAEKMLAVLTAEQKKQFTRLQGKAFDTSGLDRP